MHATLCFVQSVTKVLKARGDMRSVLVQYLFASEGLLGQGDALCGDNVPHPVWCHSVAEFTLPPVIFSALIKQYLLVSPYVNLKTFIFSLFLFCHIHNTIIYTQKKTKKNTSLCKLLISHSCVCGCLLARHQPITCLTSSDRNTPMCKWVQGGGVCFYPL